jgi:hypothetical protein
MKGVQSKRSVVYIATVVLYQIMLAAGVVFISFAIYRIVGGTIEAVVLFLPGVVALVGGIVIRHGFRKNVVQPQFNEVLH